MEIPVLIEPIAQDKYRATALSLVVEGATAEESLRKMRELLAAQQAQGARIVHVTVPANTDKMRFAGTWKLDDPMIQEYIRAVEEYRRQRDLEADAE